VFGINEQYARAEINIARLQLTHMYRRYITMCLVNVICFHLLAYSKKKMEKVLSRERVTIEGIWIGNWAFFIYIA
jgi:hypothetical protein